MISTQNRKLAAEYVAWCIFSKLNPFESDRSIQMTQMARFTKQIYSDSVGELRADRIMELVMDNEHNELLLIMGMESRLYDKIIVKLGKSEESEK